MWHLDDRKIFITLSSYIDISKSWMFIEDLSEYYKSDECKEFISKTRNKLLNIKFYFN